MSIDKKRLKEFIEALPEVKVGSTTHYNKRERVIYLWPNAKNLEETLWHELARAYLDQHVGWGKFLIFSSLFFIIFTVLGTLLLVIWSLLSPSKWFFTLVFIIICLALMLVDEKLVNYYGKLLKKEARQEILSMIRKDSFLQF